MESFPYVFVMSTAFDQCHQLFQVGFLRETALLKKVGKSLLFHLQIILCGLKVDNTVADYWTPYFISKKAARRY